MKQYKLNDDCMEVFKKMKDKMKLHYLRKDIKLKHLIIFNIFQYIDYLLIPVFIIFQIIYIIFTIIKRLFIEIFRSRFIMSDIKDVRYARWLISWTYASKIWKEYSKVKP